VTEPDERTADEPDERSGLDDPARIAAHYDDLAPHWAEIVEASAWRDGLWAAVADLLPAIEGRHVLDAGCGAGVYAEMLAESGADVTGVDVSEAMLAEARERCEADRREASMRTADARRSAPRSRGGEAASHGVSRERVPEATFHHADLAGELPLDADSVDAVLCQHVLSHLPDLSGPFAEFARVLRPGGVLVVSTHNPVHDYVVVRDGEYPATDADGLDPGIDTPADAPTYAETERFDILWGSETGSDRGTYYRRPVEGLFTPLLDAGFTVDAVVEPTLENGETGAGDGSPDLPPDSICLRATL